MANVTANKWRTLPSAFTGSMSATAQVSLKCRLTLAMRDLADGEESGCRKTQTEMFV